MEKEVAISILEDIQNTLNKEDWKNQTLKIIDIYKKNLKITENSKIKNLIKKQKEYIKNYGEYSNKTLKINKKIDEELRKIFNS